MYRIFDITIQEAERIVRNCWAERFFTTYGLVDGQHLDRYIYSLYAKRMRRWQLLCQVTWWIGVGAIIFGTISRFEFFPIGVGLLMLVLLLEKETDSMTSLLADHLATHCEIYDSSAMMGSIL